MVHFTLKGPSDTPFPVTGVVDSGADVSLVPIGWAPQLGIDISKCQTVEGGSAGGPSDFFIAEDPLLATVMSIELEINPVFGSTNDVLLGREDFFSHFEVTIDHRNTRFFLTPFD